MCVKIFAQDIAREYDQETPLEQQIEGCDKIVVNYEPKDESIPAFMKELERFAKSGIETHFSIQVTHNNHIAGIRAKNGVDKLKSDITLNEIIKAFVLNHKEADKKLEELVNHCMGSNCNVKS